jgi:kinesin family protein 3/17
MSPLQEEAVQKGKQLRALYARYRERRAEAADLQAQFQVEREDLLADYRALSQQIKLKNLAIAAFIPPAYQDFIMARCSWNEYEEQWMIAGVQAAGEQAMALRWPWHPDGCMATARSTCIRPVGVQSIYFQK